MEKGIQISKDSNNSIRYSYSVYFIFADYLLQDSFFDFSLPIQTFIAKVFNYTKRIFSLKEKNLSCEIMKMGKEGVLSNFTLC